MLAEAETLALALALALPLAETLPELKVGPDALALPLCDADCDWLPLDGVTLALCDALPLDGVTEADWLWLWESGALEKPLGCD